MDYNRVQSYIKSHVLPKLDSLPTDVQSVKQAFDAWKADWTQARAAKLDNLDATISSRASSQQVDGVKTDVAGVGGKVDTVGSTLGAKVDATLKTAQNIMGAFPTDSTVGMQSKEIGQTQFGGKKLLMSVTGKGVVNGLFLSTTQLNDYYIELDGKTLHLKCNDGANSCFFVSASSCIGAPNGENPVRFPYPHTKISTSNVGFFESTTDVNFVFLEHLMKTGTFTFDVNSSYGSFFVVSPSFRFEKSFKFYAETPDRSKSYVAEVFYTVE